MASKKRRRERHLWAVEAALKPGAMWVRDGNDSDYASTGTPYLFTNKKAASFWGRPIKVWLLREHPSE